MLIINITGQFGNQMFQYALGRHLQLRGKNVLYYTGYYRQHPGHDFALSRVFGLNLPEATTNQVLACREDRHRLIDRVRRKILGKQLHVFSEMSQVFYAFKNA